MIARAIALVAIAGVRIAAAEVAAAPAPAPDPAATRAAREANLETVERRRGLTGAFAFGPSFTIGAGTGTGAAASFRLGQVATSRAVITFELAGSAQLHQVGMKTVANNVTSFLLGGQYWIGPSLWVRGAGGAGVYKCNQCEGTTTSYTRAGIAGAVGVGIDVVRFKGLVLAVELSSINQLNRGEGLLSTNAFGLGLGFD